MVKKLTETGEKRDNHIIENQKKYDVTKHPAIIELVKFLARGAAEADFNKAVLEQQEKQKK